MNQDVVAFLERAAESTDAALDRSLPAADTRPASLHRAMRYAVFAGGKRIRPGFVHASAALGTADTTLRDDAASAIELIHTYSLVHDDLPAMDDDELRRGKPTCHVLFGEANAILTGDALLTLAFELLSRPTTWPNTSARRLRASRLLATAAGGAGMVGGQTADLEGELGSRGISADAHERPGSAEQLRFIHSNKTGALIGAASALGAIAGGLDQSITDLVFRFGATVGLAFQITDDLLDVESSSDQLGKAAGKDKGAGKLTYPGVFGVEGARREAEKTVGAAFDLLAPLGDEAEPLRALARYVIERRS